jgi:hypothetical protein
MHDHVHDHVLPRMTMFWPQELTILVATTDTLEHHQRGPAPRIHARCRHGHSHTQAAYACQRSRAPQPRAG